MISIAIRCETVRDALKEPSVHRTLTPAMIQEAARMFLDTRNYVRVTLLPEKK